MCLLVNICCTYVCVPLLRTWAVLLLQSFSTCGSSTLPRRADCQELATQRAEAEAVLQADADALEARIAALKSELAQMLAATQQAQQRAETLTADNAKAEVGFHVHYQPRLFYRVSLMYVHLDRTICVRS